MFFTLLIVTFALSVAVSHGKERWTIEIYRTIIETMQSITWMYLIVFIFALIAYVIVRSFELKNTNKSPADASDD